MCQVGQFAVPKDISKVNSSVKKRAHSTNLVVLPDLPNEVGECLVNVDTLLS